MAVKQFPYFRFFVDPFETDSVVKRAAQEPFALGAYVLLLCSQWREGSLRDDPDWLAAEARLSRPRFLKVWPLLQEKFVPVEGQPGRLRNPRLEAERQWANTKSEVNSTNGRKRRASHELANPARTLSNGQATAERTLSERSAKGEANEQRKPSETEANGKQLEEYRVESVVEKHFSLARDPSTAQHAVPAWGGQAFECLYREVTEKTPRFQENLGPLAKAIGETAAAEGLEPDPLARKLLAAFPDYVTHCKTIRWDVSPSLKGINAHFERLVDFALRGVKPIGTQAAPEKPRPVERKNTVPDANETQRRIAEMRGRS